MNRRRGPGEAECGLALRLPGLESVLLTTWSDFRNLCVNTSGWVSAGIRIPLSPPSPSRDWGGHPLQNKGKRLCSPLYLFLFLDKGKALSPKT